MTNNIKLMSSTIAGRAPTTSNIGVGNLAINHADNALYAVTTVANTVTAVTQINGPQTVTLTGDVTASANTAGNITTTLSNSGVTTGVYGSATQIPQITIDSKGRATTISNVAVTIPAAFAGDLNGNVLYDSVDNNLYITAYPIRNINTGYTGFGSLVSAYPTYSAGVLQPSGANMQTVAQNTNANITLASAGGTAKQTSITSTFGQFYLTGNMNSNDRIRGLDGVLELDLNGYSWGDDSNAKDRGSVVGVRGAVTPYGTGVVGHAMGMNAVVQQQLGGGGASVVNYATGQYINILQGGSGSSSASIGTARLITGQIAASAGNFGNVIGMHLPTTWAITSGGGSITNKYAILIDGTDSPIQTASPINTTSTLTVGSYASTSMPTGAIGMMVAVSNGGGKIAYWDTTNSRWSYMVDGSAV